MDSREDSVAFSASLGLRIPLLSDPELTTALAYGVAMEGRDIAVPSVFVVVRNRAEPVGAGAGRAPVGRAIVWKHVGESMADRPSVDRILRRVRRAARHGGGPNPGG